MDNNTQEVIRASGEILKSVTAAIDKNDYSRLASDITNTIKSVSFETKTTYTSGNRSYQNQSYTRTAQPQKYPFFAKKVSKYNGLLDIIIGGSIFACILPLAIVGGVLGGMAYGIPAAGLLAVNAIVVLAGISKLKFAKLFHQYGNIVGSNEYFKISDLAKAALKSDSEVLKDIKKMIKKGYLPRARLDATETTCMITDEAYQLYLGAEKDRLEREKRELDQQKAAINLDSRSRENLTGVEAILADGEEYIQYVRATNDIIPDTEDMSNKLYRLESIMNRIFGQVKKNPQSADDLHKLMNYYLPTTKKLLEAYVELDRQTVQGENVQQTKNEIDSAMDTINEAFEKLLDSLFQDMAWDISSDISVMKTMMAQDGLTSEGGMAMQTMPRSE
ncbi:5-bromo-4-chloroindolyl phosphate hydrolysis family protein [Butyrivibrio sp. AE2015]|uniref:5-bromo-4-chloroindolyl phosphate hydrolysis family protein n=1 Tax=Butyrivibrio sp. AE2015 TaxID=1280663 RepID=UPI0003B4C10E|nr:5-bromo-4-chloroindolyl phosphate hydrolysis family protein [Butyrivibrio sp. AE2015]